MASFAQALVPLLLALAVSPPSVPADHQESDRFDEAAERAAAAWRAFTKALESNPLPEALAPDAVTQAFVPTAVPFDLWSAIVEPFCSAPEQCIDLMDAYGRYLRHFRRELDESLRPLAVEVESLMPSFRKYEPWAIEQMCGSFRERGHASSERLRRVEEQLLATVEEISTTAEQRRRVGIARFELMIAVQQAVPFGLAACAEDVDRLVREHFADAPPDRIAAVEARLDHHRTTVTSLLRRRERAFFDGLCRAMLLRVREASEGGDLIPDFRSARSELHRLEQRLHRANREAVADAVAMLDLANGSRLEQAWLAAAFPPIHPDPTNLGWFMGGVRAAVSNDPESLRMLQGIADATEIQRVELCRRMERAYERFSWELMLTRGRGDAWPRYCDEMAALALQRLRLARSLVAATRIAVASCPDASEAATLCDRAEATLARANRLQPFPGIHRVMELDDSAPPAGEGSSR